MYQYNYAYELLTGHFETKKLKGFGIEEQSLAIVAAGTIIHYLKETRNDRLEHITSISRIEEKDYVWMDRFTIRNLELFQSNSPEGKSLFDVLNQTSTAMGSRMLNRWLALPLKDEAAVNERLDLVAYFHDHSGLMEEVISSVSRISDLERLVSKISTGRILPREILQASQSVSEIRELKRILRKESSPTLKELIKNLHDCREFSELIEVSISENPSSNPTKGDVIRAGYSSELDELRSLRDNGKSKLEEIKEREEKRTGISSLKISFNNVFGYYIEVRNTHKDKVPEEWIRKQTLVNAERYITEELKDYESRILGAEEKIHSLESGLYESVLEQCRSYLSLLKSNAASVARIDVLSSFASLALHNSYSKPLLNTGKTLSIKDGRHPVIEQQLPPDEPYIENDVLLNAEDQQIIMITGPNMSGKSALLRQTALIVLMAQIGSFVPATAAELGLTDRIFVRVGASDNISLGESTFMVEMNETASILNNLSERSLILLDEIGRGTSTYDGISIAWAIAEFLHQHPD